jgi:hypothetical protein
MTQNLLPSFNLKSKQNLVTDYLYPDEPGVEQYNFKFPYKVNYQFNSRGYRDSEWPNSLDQLKSAVWCLGDSATTGIGSPWQHTWPQMLSQAWNQRTINVSLIAAGNDFIERKCIELLDQIGPEYIVICWSFLWRRDMPEPDKIAFVTKETQKNWNDFWNTIRAPHWPDCHSFADIKNLDPKLQQEILGLYQHPVIEIDDEMCLNYFDIEKNLKSAASRSTQEEVEYFMNKINNIKQHQQSTKIFHMFVPEFASADEAMLIKQNFSNLEIPFYVIQQIDHARDGSHWDIKTSESIVNELTKIRRSMSLE